MADAHRTPDIHRPDKASNRDRVPVKQEEKVQSNVVRITPEDNVVVALREIKAGEAVSGITGLEVKATEDILQNHKIAIADIPEGSPVIKYGESIGVAGTTIRAGDWVHTHNLKSGKD